MKGVEDGGREEDACEGWHLGGERAERAEGRLTA